MKKVSAISLRVLVIALMCSLPTLFFSFKGKTTEKKANYQVTFINKYWAKMHLQIRVGNSPTPENNQSVYDGILSKDASTSVGYDVLCWYRRDANPDNPNGQFTAWTSTGCYRGSPCTVDNP